MSAIHLSPGLGNSLDCTGLTTPLCVQYMLIDEACRDFPSR